MKVINTAVTYRLRLVYRELLATFLINGLWILIPQTEMRSLGVVYRNALFDTGGGLLYRGKCLIQKKVGFQDAVDAFSNSILINVAVLCHTQLYPSRIEELCVSMATILYPSIGMMNQSIKGADRSAQCAKYPFNG